MAVSFVVITWFSHVAELSPRVLLIPVESRVVRVGGFVVAFACMETNP
jgi:hypothetical protein